MADAEQMQRAPDRAGVDRLPKPVEHEHGLIEQEIHRGSKQAPGN
jgi:hypothetical protein